MVIVSGNWVEAEMVACALEGHGIPVLILDDNICRILPTTAFIVGGVKVLVDGQDAEHALAIIGPVFGGNPPYAGNFVTVGIGGLGILALLLAPILWLGRRRISDEQFDDDGPSLS